MKKQWMLPLTALAGGAVAFVLRLWQLRAGFEADTGLPIPGSPAGIVPAVFLLVLAAALAALVLRLLPKETGTGPALPRHFAARDSRLLMPAVAGLILMALAGLADLWEGLGAGSLLQTMQAAADPYSAYETVQSFQMAGKTQLTLGALSLLSAVSLVPAVLACRRNPEAPLKTAPALLVPPVALVVRLLAVYRLDSVDPALGHYYVDLLALVFQTLAFYRLSGFAFQAGRTRRFALYTCWAAALSIAALANGGPYLSALLLNVGGSAVLLGFLLLRCSNPYIPEEPEKPEEPEAPSETPS